MKEIKLFMDKIRKAKGFDKVRFIILYGSVAKDKQNDLSDIDFCVYYDGSKRDAYKFRMKLLGNLSNKFDVHIFNSLPLYIRKEILAGKVLYYKDMKFLYNIAYSTIKEFDDFKKHYYSYIGYDGKRN